MNPLSETNVFDTKIWLRPDVFGAKLMAVPAKFWISLSRIVKLPPELNWMPLLAAPAPSISRPINAILSPELALMVMALPEAGPVIAAQP